MITIVARFSTKLSTIVATFRFFFFLSLSRLTGVSWPQNDRNSLGAENARCNLNPRSPSATRTTPMNRWKSLFSSRYATRYSFWYPKVCARSEFLGETKQRTTNFLKYSAKERKKDKNRNFKEEISLLFFFNYIKDWKLSFTKIKPVNSHIFYLISFSAILTLVNKKFRN